MRPAMSARFSPGTLVLARYGLARPHTGSLRRGRDALSGSVAGSGNAKKRPRCLAPRLPFFPLGLREAGIGEVAVERDFFCADFGAHLCDIGSFVDRYARSAIGIAHEDVAGVDPLSERIFLLPMSKFLPMYGILSFLVFQFYFSTLGVYHCFVIRII